MTRKIDNLLQVKNEYCDDPLANTTQIMPATKTAEMYPDLAGIILHPDFTRLSYIIEMHRVTIEWEADNSYDDGQVELEPIYGPIDYSDIPF